MGKYYAVAAGFKPGIYRSWPDCQKQVRKFSGAKFKSFTTEQEAQQFMQQHSKNTNTQNKLGNSNKVQTDYGKDVVVIMFDGASRGNPGKSGCGAAIQHYQSQKVLAEGYRYIGAKCTNNEAEFKSLILGLEMSKKIGAKKIVIQGDSELLINGLNQVYSIKKENLVPIFKNIQNMLKQFQVVEIKHVRREFNTLADKLSNDAIDYKSEHTKLLLSTQEIQNLLKIDSNEKQILHVKENYEEKKQSDNVIVISSDDEISLSGDIDVANQKRNHKKTNIQIGQNSKSQEDVEKEQKERSVGEKRKFDQICDSKTVIIHFCVDCRGNGEAGLGIVIEHEATKKVLLQAFKYSRSDKSVEESHLKCLVFGLELTKEIGIKNIKLYGNSQLVIDTVNGKKNVVLESIQPLQLQILKLLKKFAIVEAKIETQVLRAYNFARQAVDCKIKNVQQLVLDEDINSLLGNGQEQIVNKAIKRCKLSKNMDT